MPILAASLCLLAAGDQPAVLAPARMAFPNAMPQTVVWAWQEPEDLRSAPPQSVGVAFLAQNIFLRGTAKPDQENALAILPRHQPLFVAPGASVMAVVRLIAMSGFRDTPEMRAQATAALAGVARQPGIRALQVDFDATRSQRAFLRRCPRQPASADARRNAALHHRARQLVRRHARPR